MKTTIYFLFLLIVTCLASCDADEQDIPRTVLIQRDTIFVDSLIEETVIEDTTIIVIVRDTTFNIDTFEVNIDAL